MVAQINFKKIFIKSFLFMLIIIFSFACDKNDDQKNIIDDNAINVRFSLGEKEINKTDVVEDEEFLKSNNLPHSNKYYSYISSEKTATKDFRYFDVNENERYMEVVEEVEKNNYKWDDGKGVLSFKPPAGHSMTYGIDISRHNGDIDFKKVKAAGFDFVFIRTVYRGYGKKGTLLVDENAIANFTKAIDAGLKVGAYVFSQATNEEEAIDEAKLVIDTLKDIDLDLPIVYDPETIRNDIARTDNVGGDQFTSNAIAFCNIIKEAGFDTAIYSNLVWEDYYFDMKKLKDYDIWYADYSDMPQTPYNFKYWQFSEKGIVDGVDGFVDLNVFIK